MDPFVELEPAIYKIVKRKASGPKVYDLVFGGRSYTINKKLYGTVHELLYRMMRKINLKIYNSLTTLFLGSKGMGKTTTMKYVSNKLLDEGYPIIEVKYLDINLELIEFLSNFRNVIIQIDEFGKYFSMSHQEKMLTLLNDDPDFVRIFLLGENDKHKISQLIIDRMERCRNLLHLDRVHDADLRAYCRDNEVGLGVTESLVDINKSSSKISYDTLEAIAEEHHIFPEMDFEELISTLNCQGIIGLPYMKVIDIRIVDNDKKYIKSSDFSGRAPVPKSAFIEGNNTMYGTVTIEDVKKKTDESDEKPEGDRVRSPYGQTFNNNNTSISISANSSMVIDDIADIITIEMEQGEYTFNIVLGVELMNSGHSGPRFGGF